MKTLLLVLLVVIAGCATQEQIAAQRAAQQRAALQQQEMYHAQLVARCASFGFQQGTPGHSDCMLRLHQQVMQNAAQQQAVQPVVVPPRCSQLPPGLRGYAAAQGKCF